MDKKRKETIIKEIQYWKTSKLLPDHYCDFLLTLYTEGEQTTDTEKKDVSPFISRQSLLPFVMVQAMFLLVVLVIYFTDFSSVMQISIGIIFTIAILLLANRTKKTFLMLSYLYLLMAAMILFLLTIHAVVTFFAADSTYLVLATFVHCAAWFVIGWKWRIRFFTVAGVLGIMVLLYFFFR